MKKHEKITRGCEPKSLPARPMDMEAGWTAPKPRSKTMSKMSSKKNAILALAILTLGAAAFSSGAEARPRHWGGWGYGAAAVAGGLVLGSVLAASSANAEPAYIEDAPRRCFTVERFNRYGEVIGERRVCRSAY
jgi:hypothetical protein